MSTIDHRAEAVKLLSNAAEKPFSDRARVDRELAAVHATLALVAEQRLAVLAAVWSCKEARGEVVDAAWSELSTGLGLELDLE